MKGPFYGGHWTPYWVVSYEEFIFGWLQIYILLAIWGMDIPVIK